jgi:hypothetical protein
MVGSLIDDNGDDDDDDLSEMGGSGSTTPTPMKESTLMDRCVLTSGLYKLFPSPLTKGQNKLVRFSMSFLEANLIFVCKRPILMKDLTLFHSMGRFVGLTLRSYIWSQSYKTIYCCNLLIFLIS